MDPSTAFIPAFRADILRRFQEEGGALRGTVESRTVNAKSDHWEISGGLELTQITSRHQTTPYTPGTITRRRLNMGDYGGSERLDKLDEVKMMIDPKNVNRQNLESAWQRVIARTITDALDAPALTVSNVEVISTATLPASQTIANGGTGLTMAKLRQANRILDNAGVPRDGQRHILVSAYAIEDLLADSQVTSADYNSMNVLMNGGAALINSGTFMGLNWHMISDAIPDDSAVLGASVGTPNSLTGPILPKSGNIRTLFIYHQRAIGLSFAKEATAEVAQRWDLMGLWQVMVQGSLGAVRKLDAGVVTIDIDESV